MKVIFSDMYGTSTGVKLYSRDVDVVGEGAIEEVSDVLHTFLTVATDALSEDISHVAAKRFQSLAKTAGFQTKVTNTNYEGIVILVDLESGSIKGGIPDDKVDMDYKAMAPKRMGGSASDSPTRGFGSDSLEFSRIDREQFVPSREFGDSISPEFEPMLQESEEELW